MKVINLDSEISRSEFYRVYLESINGLINLSSKELDIFSKILEIYNEIREKTDNEEIANELLFSPKYRNKIREQIEGMTNLNFNNYLVNLRKKGVLIDEGDSKMISRKVFFKLNQDDEEISIRFNFKIVEKDEHEYESNNDSEGVGDGDVDNEVQEREPRSPVPKERERGEHDKSISEQERSDLGL